MTAPTDELTRPCPADPEGLPRLRRPAAHPRRAPGAGARDRGHLRGRAGHPEVARCAFAVAILEEAGKATPPEALMIMLRSQKSILVGDTRQLPPHIWDPMQARRCAAPASSRAANPNSHRGS